MNTSTMAKRGLLLGSLALTLAVLLGAFGAHGLKSVVTPEKLVTFETGVRYHFYHGLGLILAGLFQHLFPTTQTSLTIHSFFVGILLFSFNCYFYALTSIKTFAMIVPLGGVLFVIGWMSLTWNVLRLNQKSS
jgi:uncharacterized membrane protein YgdD (TMEM256/DUF423 family)